MSPASIRIGFALFPGTDLLDVTGPLEVLGRLQAAAEGLQVRIDLASEDGKALSFNPELRFQPTVSFRDCPPLDVLLAPGGAGTSKALLSVHYLEFLRKQAAQARYVVGICAGSLLLAAAGLLEGRQATTHWASIPLLRMFPGVEVAPGFPRYVLSGNRLTTGGVSSGLDGALALAALLGGEAAAKTIQLWIQYAPKPPFSSGTPSSAEPEILKRAEAMLIRQNQERAEIIRRLLDDPERVGEHQGRGQSPARSPKPGRAAAKGVAPRPQGPPRPSPRMRQPNPPRRSVPSGRKGKR